jgi:aldehyde:ferredoxin oxidoreductase
VTGIPLDLEQLRHQAERVWTLYKLLNVREGIGREADQAPDRWTTDPGFKEYVSETPLTREQIDGMVAAYYREQGWNPESGIPEAETVKRLGL